MKRNENFYSEKYEKALKLRESGLTIRQVSEKLGLPYITVYTWFRRGKRKTASQRLYEFLKDRGPMPEGVLEKEFPKLLDLFPKAVARGYEIERIETELSGKLKRWYLVSGDSRLEERLESYRKAIREMKDRAKKFFHMD